AEHVRVLADEAEGFAQLVRVILAAVEPIDEHLAFGRRIEAAEHSPERRFTRRDPADDPDPLARLDLEVEPGQRVPRCVGIPEADVAKFDMPRADFRNDAPYRAVALIL